MCLFILFLKLYKSCCSIQGVLSVCGSYMQNFQLPRFNSINTSPSTAMVQISFKLVR